MNVIKKIIVVLLIFVVVGGLVIFKLKLNSKEYVKNEEEIITEEENELEEEEEKDEIIKVSVDVKGAVNNPGVYELDSNKKVIDVINLAGGLKDDADTSLINLARKVVDEMVVVIYTSSEVEKAIKDEDNKLIKSIDGTCDCPNIVNDGCLYQKDETTVKSNDNSNKNSDNSNSSNGNEVDNTKTNVNVKVNINTASISELQTLSGVGESKARAIIEYRESNGNFQSIEDIKNVKGIGDSVYEKIKDSITV